MKNKITKISFYCLVFALSLAQPSLADFQEVKTSREVAELPTAEFLNQALHYTNVGIALVFILFLLLMLAAGIEFLSAGGDEGSLEAAHRMWRIASIGLISAMLGYIVVNLIKFFI